MNKAETAVIAVALGSIENSACFCQFADRKITIPEWVGLFNAVAGYGWDIEAMMLAGKRVFYLKRLINYLYGRTAADGALTPRMLELARDGEPEGIEINFDGMKETFYRLMDMDPVKGIPVKSALIACGIAEEAERVRNHPPLVEGKDMEVSAGLTIRGLVTILDIPAELKLMIFVNGRRKDPDDILEHGNEVRRITLLSGG